MDYTADYASWFSPPPSNSATASLKYHHAGDASGTVGMIKPDNGKSKGVSAVRVIGGSFVAATLLSLGLVWYNLRMRGAGRGADVYDRVLVYEASEDEEAASRLALSCVGCKAGRQGARRPSSKAGSNASRDCAHHDCRMGGRNAERYVHASAEDDDDNDCAALPVVAIDKMESTRQDKVCARGCLYVPALCPVVSRCGTRCGIQIP